MAKPEKSTKNDATNVRQATGPNAHATEPVATPATAPGDQAMEPDEGGDGTDPIGFATGTPNEGDDGDDTDEDVNMAIGLKVGPSSHDMMTRFIIGIDLMLMRQLNRFGFSNEGKAKLASTGILRPLDILRLNKKQVSNLSKRKDKDSMDYFPAINEV